MTRERLRYNVTSAGPNVPLAWLTIIAKSPPLLPGGSPIGCFHTGLGRPVGDVESVELEGEEPLGDASPRGEHSLVPACGGAVGSHLSRWTPRCSACAHAGWRDVYELGRRGVCRFPSISSEQGSVTLQGPQREARSYQKSPRSHLYRQALSSAGLRKMRLDKKRLRQLANALALDPRTGETIATLFQRCLKRASHLSDLMINTESSDEARGDEWPWWND